MSGDHDVVTEVVEEVVGAYVTAEAHRAGGVDAVDGSVMEPVATDRRPRTAAQVRDPAIGVDRIRKACRIWTDCETPPIFVHMSRYLLLAWLLACGTQCAGAQDDVIRHQPEPSGSESMAPAYDDAAPLPSTEAPQPTEVGPSETRIHAGAGVAFDLGAGWMLSGEESSTLLAASPEGQAVLMFHVAEPDHLKQTLKAIRKTLAAEVKEAYFGPAKEKKLGELTVEYASGAGKLEGRPVELGQLLVATPTGKVLVVVAVIEAAAPATSKKQARHTLESIRPQPQ
jgi:hypothetical protein